MSVRVHVSVPLLLIVGLGCSGDTPGGSDADAGATGGGDTDASTAGGRDAATPTDAGEPAPDSPYDVVVDVPAAGPYGEHTFRLPARSNWVNTGLFLQAGETATITATGSWTYAGQEVGPDGLSDPPDVAGCPGGMLVARTGLHWEAPRTCIGGDGTFTAEREGILFVAANVSDDLAEIYEQRRLSADGDIELTVASDGGTVPSVLAGELGAIDVAAIESGWLEIRGRHVIVTVDTATAIQDQATAADAIETLDAIYDQHVALRGLLPSLGQKIRFFPDPDVVDVGYMLAGNPLRCSPEIMNGGPTQRILRAADPMTDIWGFAHELGHDFTFSNGTWTYMLPNLESWPNIFSVHALTSLGRTDFQPNLDTYCDGREVYLAAPSYPALRADPFLQLCFLLEVGEAHGGWSFWTAYFALLDPLTNADIPADSSDPQDRQLWGWVRDRFNEAADDDVTPLFEQWAVPLP